LANQLCDKLNLPVPAVDS